MRHVMRSASFNEHSNDDAEESRNLRHYLLGSGHRDERRLRLYPFDPITDLWKIVQGETAFIRDMRVGEERDVGDGIVTDEEIIFSQVVLHDSERCPAAFAPGQQNRIAFWRIRFVL